MLQATSLPSTLRPRLLASWLFVVAALIVAIVVVGGITRLTESGLSITSWKPLSGTIPPLTDTQWQAEFANYRKIPQYEAFNHGMTLAGFKAIFFWEYLHRILGRIVGLAFLLPLVWFAVRRRIPRGYLPRLIALFLLIALQGTFGWLMVRSGLSGRTEVAPEWLATHLLTALLTLAGMVWTALDLRALAGNRLAAPARLRAVPAIALALLFAQILFGALTAGLRAGYAFSSWPLMGNEIFPAGTPLTHPLWGNLFGNPVVVQFVHRWLAFIVVAGLMTLAARARRAGDRRAGLVVIGLVCLQIALGVATLLSGVEIAVAVGHQLNAALLVIAATVAAHAIGRHTA
jgi:cytochrome c oxidase assembly protein subunit 15